MMKWEYTKPYLNMDEKVKKTDKEDIHHLYPTSRWGLNISQNMLRIYRQVHNSLHWLFGNGTPVENFERLLEMQDKCLGEWFKDELRKVLDWADETRYYKDWVHRKK